MYTIRSTSASGFCVKQAPPQISSYVPDANSIDRFRDCVGVWVSFAGSGFFGAYSDLLAPLGLRPNWVTAMATIEQEPGISQSALGRKLLVNRASAMELCVKLEEADLISRQAMPGRNRTGLTLTPTGAERLNEAFAIEARMTESYLEGVSESDRAIFLSVLRRLVSGTDRPEKA